MKQIDLTCIIDDDPIYIYGAKRVLEIADFSKSFMIFNNGKEALEALQPLFTHGKNIPDIILLDINMPVMDGWQFLDELMKINSAKKIKIFIVSSSIDTRDIEKAKRYEIVEDYILKPITIEKINKLQLAKQK